MEFYDYVTLQQSIKRAYGKQQIDTIMRGLIQDDRTDVNVFIENTWELAGRPYFKLYPSMVKALANLNLNLKSNQITWPKQLAEGITPFLIKFPQQAVTLDLEEPTPLHAVLVFKVTRESPGIIAENNESLLHILWYTGLTTHKFESSEKTLVIPNTSCFVFNTGTDKEVESEFEEVFCTSNDSDHSKDRIEMKPCYKNILRYVIGTILLASDADNELILPEVLSKHELKFEETGDLALVDKAKRNGKYGWSIGKELEREVETNTHFRVPHFAIRHTGPNGSIPLLRPIKGSIVNRKKFVAQYEEEETNA